MLDQRLSFHFLPPTKLEIPATRARELLRPQIEARVGRSFMQSRATLVCAPAGCGKTTLVAHALEWVKSAATSFWISLDEDDDLPRLLAGLVTAVDAVDVPWRLSLQTLILISETEGPGRAADHICDALAATEIDKGILVLDDLHKVPWQPVFPFLDRLIERLPHHWSIVLTSRADPPLALARMRARGELSEFRGDDLKFSFNEFVALARIRGHASSSEKELETIWRHMNGWPAGCVIALMSDVPDGAREAHQAHAFDYFSSEILSQLPYDLRQFLLRSAILPELDASRCVAVTGDTNARRWLSEIEKRGLFCFVVPAKDRVLRLHDLFRDFLLDRLRRDMPEELPILNKRAAEAEKSPACRIFYQLEAGDFAGAESTLGAAAPSMLLNGAREQVIRMANLFPPEVGRKSPTLAFVRGLHASSHSLWGESRKQMREAAKLFEDAGALDSAYLARSHETVACIGLSLPGDAELLHRSLSEEPLKPEAAALCALAGYWIAKVQGSPDDEVRAFDLLLDALERSDDPLVWNECALHLHLGGQVGMSVRTERYATSALALAGEEHFSLRDSALCMRTWHYLLLGHFQKAEGLVKEIEETQKWDGKPFPVRTTCFLFRTILASLYNQTEDVHRYNAAHLAEFDGREGITWFYWRGVATALRGRLLLSLKDWEGASEVIRHLRETLQMVPSAVLRATKAYIEAGLCLFQEGTRLPNEIAEILAEDDLRGDILALAPAKQAMLAINHARCGEVREAWKRLSPLIEHFRRTGEMLHLLLLGRHLISELVGMPAIDEVTATQRECMRELLEVLESVFLPQVPSIVTPPSDLTVREMDVLERLVHGDSNKAIARVLGLSPHTVKRHVANILEKLDVDSRGRAAEWYRRTGPTSDMSALFHGR